MVERIEHLHPELHLDLFSYLERLDKTKVEIPVRRGDESIPTDPVLARRGKTKRHRWVNATGERLTGDGIDADRFK